MSIEDTNTIDIIAIDEKDHEIKMIISDHLEWGVDDESHMYLLQEKINSYLRFYEGGEIYQYYPESKNLAVTIKIVGKYPLSQKAEWFYGQMKPVIEGANLKVKFELYGA